MLPGNDLILICPYCDAPRQMMSWSSGNTFGAVYWSDGYCYYPSLLLNDPVQQCADCKRYFWVRKDDEPVYADASNAELSLLSSLQWQEALTQFKEEGILDSQKERLIRLNILWILNHIETPIVNQTLWDDNTRVLLQLMSPSKDEDILLCAELFRENRNFHSCIRLLRSYNFPSKRQELIAGKILEAAGKLDSKVFKLVIDEHV